MVVFEGEREVAGRTAASCLERAFFGGEHLVVGCFLVVVAAVEGTVAAVEAVVGGRVVVAVVEGTVAAVVVVVAVEAVVE